MTGQAPSRSTTARTIFVARRMATHGVSSNGQFILAAVATGVVASIILDNAR